HGARQHEAVVGVDAGLAGMPGRDQVRERERVVLERKRGRPQRRLEAERRATIPGRRARARRSQDHQAHHPARKAPVPDELQCLTLNGGGVVRQERVLSFDPVARMSRTIAALYRFLYAAFLSRLPEPAAVALGQNFLRVLPIDRLSWFRLDDPRLATSLG